MLAAWQRAWPCTHDGALHNCAAVRASVRAMSNVQCPVYNVQCPMSSVQCPMSNVQRDKDWNGHGVSQVIRTHQDKLRFRHQNDANTCCAKRYTSHLKSQRSALRISNWEHFPFRGRNAFQKNKDFVLAMKHQLELHQASCAAEHSACVASSAQML